MVLPVTVSVSPCMRPCIEESRHQHREASLAVDVVHDVLAERLHVGDVRNLVADPVEVVPRVSSTCASRAIARRWSTTLVEPPRAMATAIAFSNASLVRMSRAVMAALQQPDHGLTGAVREVVAAAIGGRRGCGARQRHPERFGDTRHRVRGVHAAAGALAGCECTFDALGVLEAHLAGLDGADRFERVDDRDRLLGAVAQLDPPGCDRTRVEEDGCEVEPRGRHQHPGDRLVAARE